MYKKNIFILMLIFLMLLIILLIRNQKISNEIKELNDKFLEPDILNEISSNHYTLLNYQSISRDILRHKCKNSKKIGSYSNYIQKMSNPINNDNSAIKGNTLIY